MAELDIKDTVRGMDDGAETIDANTKVLAAALQKFVDYDALKGQTGWSGSNTMGANQTVTSTIPLSSCQNGWRVVCWMSSGKTDRCEGFIPKWWPDTFGSATVAIVMHTATGGHVTQKTFTVTDTTLTGNANNVLTTDVAGKPNDFVLGQIIAD